APANGAGAADGLSRSANAERADVGPAALGVAPGFVEAFAGEGVLDGHGRLRLDALGQRRVVCALVAASLVVLGVQAARLDRGLARLHLGARVTFALANLDVHRGIPDGDDLFQERSALGLGELDE